MVVTSPRGREMATTLPGNVYDFEGDTVVAAILQATGAELDRLRAAIDDLLAQNYVATATWALDRWEEELGLVTSPGAIEAERRERIIGHLRGYGTANKAAIVQVAASFGYGTIGVEDINDNPGAALADYTIRIEILDQQGIPANLVDFQTAIRKIVSAHLAIEYAFNFTTLDELSAQGWTLDQLDGDTPGGPAGAPLTLAELEALL